MISDSCISMHPNSLSLYSMLYTDNGESYSKGNSTIHNHKIRNVKNLSPQSKKKISRAITYMSTITPDKKAFNPKFNSTFQFRLIFITLTLSYRQQHSDTTIKNEVLHPFVDYIKKVYGVKYFIWKAERQANKNIHFHLIIDQYIPHHIVRTKWNQYQDRLQYISKYHNDKLNEKAFPATQEEYYSVNSTDIHSTRKIKDLSKYMCKYLLKDEKTCRQRIKRKSLLWLLPKKENNYSVSYGAKKFLKSEQAIGRIWGCSYNLSNIKGATDSIYFELWEDINKLKSSNKVFIKEEAYFCYISYNLQLLYELKLYNLLAFLNKYLNTQFDYSLNTLLPFDVHD